jgi:hypothetical protein
MPGELPLFHHQKFYQKWLASDGTRVPWVDLGRFSLLNNLGYFIHGKILFGNTIMMCHSRYRFS